MLFDKNGLLHVDLRFSIPYEIVAYAFNTIRLEGPMFGVIHYNTAFAQRCDLCKTTSKEFSNLNNMVKREVTTSKAPPEHFVF
jgi:hypothetical protein